MTNQNLNLNETLNIVEKELTTLSVPYIWSIAHYHLKRELVSSFVNEKSFFDVTFVIKNLNKRKPRVLRDGNYRIKRLYPIVKVLLTTVVKELFKHPFFRLLNLRKKFSLKMLKPNLVFRTDEWILANEKQYNTSIKQVESNRLSYEEQFSDLNKLLSNSAYVETIKNSNRLKMKNLRKKFKKTSDRLIIKKKKTSKHLDKLSMNSALTDKIIKSIKINGEIKNFTQDECKINGKNNIWTRLTGAHYLALCPNLIIETKKNLRFNFFNLKNIIKIGSIKARKKRKLPKSKIARYVPGAVETVIRFKNYVEKKYNFLDMVYEVLGEIEQVERLKFEREYLKSSKTWPYTRYVTGEIVVEEEQPIPLMERLRSGNFFKATRTVETLKRVTVAALPLRYINFPRLKRPTSRQKTIINRRKVYLKFFWAKKEEETFLNKGIFIINQVVAKKDLDKVL